MQNKSLKIAREKAESFRFSAELRGNIQPHDDTATEEASRQASLNYLEISESLTPSIARALSDSLDRLKIPGDTVQAFVYADPSVQAYYMGKSRDKCLLQFSSSLIDLLTEEELSFVIGHEIGHFLLRHSTTGPRSTLKGDLLRSKRYQEISSDRLGLVTCQSFDVAARAMMKLASGLSDEYLTFDIDPFLSQIQEFPKDTRHVGGITTHPPTLIRTQALSWFSECMTPLHPDTTPDPRKMTTLDTKVQELLDPHISQEEAVEADSIRQAESALKLWITAEAVCEDGKLDKHEQEKMVVILGKEKANRLKNFLENLGGIDIIKQTIAMKKARSVEEYEECTGEPANVLLSRIQAEIGQALK